MARDPTVWHSALSWDGQRIECPPVLCLQLGANIHYEAELLANRVAERARVQKRPRGESESSPLFFHTNVRPLRLSITRTNPTRTLGWGFISGGGGPLRTSTPPGGIALQTASAQRLWFAAALKSPGNAGRATYATSNRGLQIN